MAGGVPEINVPTAQTEATPVTQVPTPPLASFAGAHVGAALDDTGEKLFQVGMKSYHRTVENIAQDAETEFQKQALKIRDNYRNLKNADAMTAHGSATEALEKARQDIEQTIPSKDGRALYKTNSLRGMRFVQESVDQHFEQQSNSFDDTTYRAGQLQRASLAAGVAQNPVYKPGDADKILQEMHDRAYDRFTARGLPKETAEVIANNEVRSGTDALFQILTHKDNPNRVLAQQELDKYAAKGWVDKTAYRDVLGTINSASAKSWAKQQFIGMPREDGNHMPDAEGAVPHSAVLEAAGKIPDTDPFKGEKVDALEQEWSAHERSFELAGHELRRSVMTQGMAAGGGKFVVPKDSLDWQKFTRLHGDLASLIEQKATDRDWQSWHRGRMTARDASHEAAGNARAYLDKLSLDDIKGITDPEMETILMRSYKGPGVEPSGEDKAKTLEYLKRLQTGKFDPIERKFGQIAQQALEDSYHGNRQLVRAAMNQAHYVLDDLYSASVKAGKPLGESDLRAKLVDMFNKKNGIFGTSAFGSREGESYQRRGPVQEFAPGTADWKKLPVGTKFRFKSDPAGQWRER